ncbi:hypothetical protein BJ170DRAFT_166482 [Xylariales sp. AK1849]|nr:hypothetical protein BJ170DRAFT_166482 [Xylariales sp. AK1849]
MASQGFRRDGSIVPDLRGLPMEDYMADGAERWARHQLQDAEHEADNEASLSPDLQRELDRCKNTLATAAENFEKVESMVIGRLRTANFQPAKAEATIKKLQVHQPKKLRRLLRCLNEIEALQARCRGQDNFPVAPRNCESLRPPTLFSVINERAPTIARERSGSEDPLNDLLYSPNVSKKRQHESTVTQDRLEQYAQRARLGRLPTKFKRTISINDVEDLEQVYSFFGSQIVIRCDGSCHLGHSCEMVLKEPPFTGPGPPSVHGKGYTERQLVGQLAIEVTDYGG